MTAPETFPRPDHAPDDVRAWLIDAERTVLDAMECPDIYVKITATAALDMGEGKRRKKWGGSAPFSDEEKARLTHAGNLLDARLIGYKRAAWLLRQVARARMLLAAAGDGTLPMEAL